MLSPNGGPDGDGCIDITLFDSNNRKFQTKSAMKGE